MKNLGKDTRRRGQSFDSADSGDEGASYSPKMKQKRSTGRRHFRSSRSSDTEPNNNNQEANLYKKLKHKDTTISDQLGYVADSQGRTADLVGGSVADRVGDNADSPRFGNHADEVALDKFAHRHDYVGEEAPKLTCTDLPHPYGFAGRPNHHYD
mmetsp:Transcript_23982/g.36805  ORF Transcript_23982/g.36805 Transcript_23982/m.36805 type:complete len:154 (+) Transcript_23982:310-771(+)